MPLNRGATRLEATLPEAMSRKGGALHDEDGGSGPWIKSDQSDMLFGTLIVLNAVVIGIDIEVTVRNGGSSDETLFWVQFGFLVVFIIELGLRVRADGLRFFITPSGLFDVVIILSSAAEAAVALSGSDSQLPAVGVMRIFRLLRIARIVRLLKVCPELKLLLSGLAAALQAVFWVFLLLVVVMYVCSLLTTMQLGQDMSNDELRHYFGGVGRSFFSHFMVLTLEGFPDITRAAGEPISSNWYWYLYFTGFIVFSNIILMNLVTGIVCESVVATAREEDMGNVYAEESLKFAEVLREVLKSKGIEGRAEIRFDEGEHRFQDLIRDEYVRELLNSIDVCLEIEDHQLFDILDEDGTGSLNTDQFVSSLLRLRGSKEMMHSLLVQADVIRGGQRVKEQISNSATVIEEYSTKVADALRQRVSQSLQEVRGDLERCLSRISSPPLPPPASSPGGGLEQGGSSSSGYWPHAPQSVQVAPPVDEPDVLRVRAAVAAAEAGASQAEAALGRLQSELAASRARCRALEARLLRRSEGVQTEGAPAAWVEPQPALSGWGGSARRDAAAGPERLDDLEGDAYEQYSGVPTPCDRSAASPADSAITTPQAAELAAGRSPAHDAAPAGARVAVAGLSRASSVGERPCRPALRQLSDVERQRLLDTFSDSPENAKQQALIVTHDAD